MYEIKDNSSTSTKSFRSISLKDGMTNLAGNLALCLLPQPSYGTPHSDGTCSTA